MSNYAKFVIKYSCNLESSWRQKEVCGECITSFREIQWVSIWYARCDVEDYIVLFCYWITINYIIFTFPLIGATILRREGSDSYPVLCSRIAYLLNNMLNN